VLEAADAFRVYTREKLVATSTRSRDPFPERRPGSALSMSEAPIKVLCIGGTGQNGATLLSRMLGRLPGFVPVGELGYLWDKGLMENVECGCGTPFCECPFWSRVGAEAFGGWQNVDRDEALRLRGAVKFKGRPLAHPLSLPFITFPRMAPRYRKDFLRYSELMQRLYRGIQSVSGDGIIVDSMKRPSHVYMLRQVPGLELRLVHLVRDSRGVAHSNSKLVERQGNLKGPYRARRPPWKAASRWMWINLSFHVLPRLGVPSYLARYENLVRRPEEELTRIANLAGVGIERGDLAFIADDGMDLARDHLVAGNRMRLQAGRVPLKADEEWRTALSPRQRRVVSSLTWPLLRRYGYSLRQGEGESAA
jgi:hypothetical protein